MKLVAFSLSFLLSVTVFAQKNEASTFNQYKSENSQLLTFTDVVTSELEAKAFVEKTIIQDGSSSVRLLSANKSLTGMHYTFAQTNAGVDIYQAIIKVNTDSKGNIISVLSNAQAFNTTESAPWPSVSKSLASLPSGNSVTNAQKIWVKKDGKFVKCILTQYLSPLGYYQEQITDISNDVIFEQELTNHFAPVDTTAKALVYRPDPLTKAHTIYGGKFIDNNDSSSPELDAQRDTVAIDITFDNGTFYLENDFIKIVANSAPIIAPVTNTIPEFYYDRSEYGFEEVNVMYHITKMQNYIQSLGFTNIVNYQIAVDCHGFNGADNSAFSSGTTPPSIVFGEGGVDDAEDADVIIHEYTHAIMYSATPNTNFGTERNALDEAFGDFMAISYSSTYDIFHSDYVFTWDGHNEFWNGRLGVSNAMYPADLQFNLYKDAPIWSSVLLRIERNIGRDVAIKIAIESAFSYSSSMTMAQAAAIFINTDSLMNNGANYADICWIFKDKGMVNSCTVSKPADLLNTPGLSKINLQVLNSENFAKGMSNLSITASKNFEILIYSTSGKLIQKYSSVDHTVSLNPENFDSGTYIYKVISGTESGAFKIQKY